MISHRARTWTVAALAAATLFVALPGCARQAADQPGDVGPVPTLSKEELERAKLAAETRQIDAQTRREASASSAVLEWAPFVTALVALAGIGLTLRGQRRERQVDRRKRHDEELARAVQNLGAERAAVRMNAAAALTAFLGPDDHEFHTDLLTVVIANLKIEHDTSVADVLIRDLELAVRQCLRGRRQLAELDLSRARWLGRLDLHDVDLGDTPVDIAFANLTRANLCGLVARRTLRGREAWLIRARLSRANLQEARLDGAQCAMAQFHQARLASATFKGAVLQQAQFQQSSLMAAHFEEADLTGASFVDADVSDAWFCDAHHRRPAILDEAALRSLAKTRRRGGRRTWRKAHFIPAHRHAIAVYDGDLSAIQPFAARLVRRGRLDEAGRWYDTALREGITISPNALGKLGRSLRDRGDHIEAVRWLDLAAQRGDQDAAAALRQLQPS